MRSITGLRQGPPLLRRLGGGALLLALLPALLGAQVQQRVVRALTFEGNRALDDVLLAAAIRTTNSSAFARLPLVRGLGLGDKRKFNETDFRGDVERLKVLYRYSGYPAVAVDTVVRRTDEDVWVTFRITEGAPILLERVTVTGLDSLDAKARDEVLRDLPIEEGDVFNRFVLTESRDSVVLRLRDRGYPTATALAPIFTVDTAARRATVSVPFETGRYAVVGDISVHGQVQVDSGFIASLVTARAGEPYRNSDRFRSQRALYNAELFRFAEVGIDTTRFQAGDSVVPLRVNVIEGRAHRARASIGYATNDCFRAGVGWTARNFLGNGRLFDVSGRLGKIGVGTPFNAGLENSLCGSLKEDSVGSRLATYGIDLSLRRNGFLSPDNSMTIGLFSERRSEFKVYMREEIGTAVTLRRETAARIPVTLGYRISYGVTNANPASFCAYFNACAVADIAQLRQRRVLATLTLSTARQRVNNLLDPTRGTLASLEATHASRFIGSSRFQQFTRVVGDLSGYVPVSKGVVLAGHVRLGGIFAPKVEVGGESRNFVLPEQRFYAGGPNDVRGFDRNELGPVVYVLPPSAIDSAGAIDSSQARISATGGDRVAIANLEVRFPSPVLSPRLRFAAFVDAGALWDRNTPARLRITPGVGLRFASPLGPIRFDLGWNRYQLERGTLYTTTERGDLDVVATGFRQERKRGRITVHFSVGQAF